MTNGDFAVEAGVDFLCVTEHRLVSARARSEWKRLRGRNISSIWSPASQEFSGVGNAGVGVVSLRGAPLALPTSATPGFERFFSLCRAVRCLVPLGDRRFMHLVVLYGFQGADTDAEQLALTEQLFDAALGELAVVTGGQPCLIVGDFNVEPTKIPCLAKGSRLGSGLIWKLLGLLHLAVFLLSPANAHGTLILEIGGIFRLDAHCVLLRSCPVRL